MTWQQLKDLVDTLDPEQLLQDVRAVETTDGEQLGVDFDVVEMGFSHGDPDMSLVNGQAFLVLSKES